MDMKTKGFTELTQQEMETTEGGLKAFQTIIMGVHNVIGSAMKGFFGGLFGSLGGGSSSGGSSDQYCGGKYTGCSGGSHGDYCDFG